MIINKAVITISRNRNGPTCCL